jgi:hypothetical protein
MMLVLLGVFLVVVLFWVIRTVLQRSAVVASVSVLLVLVLVD